eukprot:scaffold7760_cov286-Pinguiococcus_pyrenoidosus.AAC.4
MEVTSALSSRVPRQSRPSSADNAGGTPALPWAFPGLPLLAISQSRTGTSAQHLLGRPHNPAFEAAKPAFPHRRRSVASMQSTFGAGTLSTDGGEGSRTSWSVKSLTTAALRAGGDASQADQPARVGRLLRKTSQLRTGSSAGGESLQQLVPQATADALQNIANATIRIGGLQDASEPQDSSAAATREEDLVMLTKEVPSDGIIFSHIRAHPGLLVVQRTEEARKANPERLNLDRRQLTSCPMLHHEQHLKLLNYQNNYISKVTGLGGLSKLIFLDLYNNCIEQLGTGLACVPSLRVLMLGKNRIRHITNLEKLRNLDVLDLHSNEISTIEGLEALAELRVLNLAGNRIEAVENVCGLQSLTEINLRRNRIRSVSELHLLPGLQRVFLSNNSIGKRSYRKASTARRLTIAFKSASPTSSAFCGCDRWWSSRWMAIPSGTPGEADTGGIHASEHFLRRKGDSRGLRVGRTSSPTRGR